MSEWAFLSYSWPWRKSFQLFKVEYDKCGLLIYGFLMLSLCSLHTHIAESFYHKLDVETFKGFSASIKMITWFLFCILLMWCITMIGRYWHIILNHPWIPEINPAWSWCMILLIYCWIWFSNILLRIFLYLCSSGFLAYNLFLGCPLLVLVLG